MAELKVYIDDWYTDDDPDVEARLEKARERIREIASMIDAQDFEDEVDRETFVPDTCQYVEYIQVNGVFEVEDMASARQTLSEKGIDVL